jgi:hypothetical protein
MRGTESHIDLSRIDDRLLDGLDFCREVYDLFDQIKCEPDGKSRLRLQSNGDRRFTDKRLVEELLPLAYYIQVRYRVGKRISVRWRSGSQHCDAIFCFDGSLVERDGAPREVFVEVTTSVHPNEHLVRQRVHQSGGSFGPHGTYREGKKIVSKPYVSDGLQSPKDLAALIIASLNDKARKEYPRETVLVVNCLPPCLWMDETEWKHAIEQVRIEKPIISFREVFLVDMLTLNTATLFRDR